MYGLLHASLDWLSAGIIVVFGLIVFLRKISNGDWLGVIFGGGVWFFVYTLHSGSTTGIMTATFAALLFDLVGMRLLGIGGKK